VAIRIRVTVSNLIPSKQPGRSCQPSIEVEDEAVPGESPMEAFRRISVMANAMFAREALDQLRYTDRMAQMGNERWCDELLSTVAQEHPALNVVNATPVPKAVADAFEKLVEALTRAVPGESHPTPKQG
jgi:hypothetical protein